MSIITNVPADSTDCGILLVVFVSLRFGGAGGNSGNSSRGCNSGFAKCLDFVSRERGRREPAFELVRARILSSLLLNDSGAADAETGILPNKFFDFLGAMFSR